MKGELPTYNVRGTLAEWQENIGKYLEGNSRLLGSVLTSLVTPLLTPLGREGFGIHTRGRSSIGKSVTSHVASSVYGSKVRNWKATDNAAEAWGLESNDNILILDETGQVSADVLADSIYMLFNGQGKGRMKRSGGTRPTSEFKICVWSNGEIGTESKIQESKRNKTYNAGQAVRLMEIPADAGKDFGIFETLHTFNDGAEFSSHLKDMSKIYCGTLGDAWLTLLTEDKEEILRRVEEYEREFREKTPLEAKADGQVKRAISHYALMAGAGEVAIEKGLLPLEKGSAIKECQILLNAWIVQRGGLGSHEVMDFKKRVINFLLEHGNSRFQRIGDDVRTNNMMGYWDEQNGKVTYYAYPPIFEKELIKGGDPKLLLTALIDAGILEKDKGQFSKQKKLPPKEGSVSDNKKNERVYWLTLPDDS